MEDLNVVFCPDCGIFYLKEKDQKAGETRYAYADDFVEETATKVDENIYQCAECGALFELDPHTADNSKLVVNRNPRHAKQMTIDEQVEIDVNEWKKLFGENIEYVPIEATEKFFNYMSRVSNDVSWYDETKKILNEKHNEQKQRQ